MKHKGFTLVELLSIIVVLGIIVVIAVPRLSKSTKEIKEEQYERTINVIENAARAYYSNNRGDIKIPLDKLQQEKLLTTNLVNPITEEKITGCVRVSTDNEGIYRYMYSSDCEARIVNLTVELNDGNTTQTFETSYLEGTKIKLENPTRGVDTFKGWKVTNGDSIIIDDRLTIGSESTTIYAMWSGAPKLTVNKNGGNTSQTFAYSYRTGTILTLENASKTGHTFAGWTVEEGDGIISNGTLTFGLEDTTIKANYTPNTYTITYNLNGGSGSVNPTTYTYASSGTINLSSTVPTRTGYAFVGWAETSDATTAKYPSNGAYNKNTVGNKTLYAVWNVQSITCDSGKYLPKNELTCASCPSGYTCPGGTYSFNESTDQGKNATVIVSYSCNNGNSGTSSSYVLTYTGNCTVIDDGSNNWRVKFLTSGTLKLNYAASIDVFLVGGGGGGSYHGGGGGGGYTTTAKNVSVTANTQYTITIGSGGSGGSCDGSGGRGGTTSAFSKTAAGGYGGTSDLCTGSKARNTPGGNGGSGGGGGSVGGTYAGAGGSNGGNGGTGNYGNGWSGSGPGGTGQGTTTREFGETSGTLYAGGGGGGTAGGATAAGAGGTGGGQGGNANNSGSGTVNTGGGGGGSYYGGRPGGSGIVVIRNVR